MKHRKAFVGILALVMLFMLLLPTDAFALIDVCIWYSSGCFVTVVQYSWGMADIGWEMFIDCYFPGDGGYWSGGGGWGGECAGITFPVM